MSKIRTLVAAVAFCCQGAPYVQAADLDAFGDFCGGLSDASIAWASALDRADTGRDKTVTLGGGCQYTFTRQPAPIPAGVTVEGAGPSSSGVVCRFSGGICVELRGIGAQLRGVYLWTPKGHSGNVGLLIQPRTGQRGGAGYEIVRDVVITSGDGGQWLVPIYVDGSRNLTAAGAVFGARAVVLDNVRGFNATYACAILWDAPDLQWTAGNCYQGAGATDKLIIGGAGPVRVLWR